MGYEEVDLPYHMPGGGAIVLVLLFVIISLLVIGWLTK